MTRIAKASRIAACALTLAAVTGAVALLAQGQTGTVFVRAADTGGTLLTDLRPGDFRIALDGAPGKVNVVRYVGGPRRILVLIDNISQQLVVPMRTGAQALIDGLPQDDEIGLITMAGQLHILAEPTTDRARLRDIVANLNVEAGSTVLMDAVVEGYQRFLEKEDRVPIVVILTTEAVESSHTRDEIFTKFTQGFAARGGVAHAVVISLAALGGGPRPTDGGNRWPDNAILSADTDAQSIVSLHITKATGGRYELVNAISAVTEQLKNVAADITADRQRLTGWYKLDFAIAKNFRAIRVEAVRPNTTIQLSQDRPKASAAR